MTITVPSADLEYYPKSEPHKAWTGSLGVLKEFEKKGNSCSFKN